MGVDNLGKEMIEAASAIRKSQTAQTKDIKKTLNLYKEYRKTLIGVLIDLHWLRILGSQSKVIAANTEMLGKAFGYLIDMALLPLLPAMVQFTKYIIGVAKWMRELGKPGRMFIAALAAIVIGIMTMGTVISYAITAITGFSAALNVVTGQLGVLSGILSTLLAVLLVPLMAFLAMRNTIKPIQNRKKIEGEISNITRSEGFLPPSELFLPKFAEGGVATKATAGIFGEGGAEAIIPLSKIGEVMGSVLGSGAGFVNTLTQAAMGGGGVGGGLNVGGKPTELLAKGFSWVATSVNQGFKTANQLISAILTLLPNIGSFIFGGAINFAEWLKEKLLSGIDLAREIANVIIDWVKKSLKDTINLAKEVYDAIIKWIKDSLKETFDLATKLWEYIVEWIKTGLKNTIDLATKLWEYIKDWFVKSLSSTIDFAIEIIDVLMNWIKDGFKNPVEMALKILEIILNWIKQELSGVWDLIVKIGTAIIEWVVKELSGTWELLIKVGGAILDWVVKELSGTWGLIIKISDAILTWIGKELGNVIGLVISIKDKILEWLTKEFPTAVGLAIAIKDKILGWVINSLIATPFNLAVRLEQAVINFIKNRFGIDLGSVLSGGGNAAPSGGTTTGGSSTGGTVTPKPPFVSPPPTPSTPSTGGTGGGISVGDAPTNPGSGWESRGTSITGQTLYQPVVKAIREFGTMGWQLWQVMDGLELWGPRGEKIGYNLAAMTIPKEGLFDACLANGGGWNWDTASCIPSFANGGVMPNTGLAYLHEGETVIPKSGGGSAGGITINNPTFVVSGRTERELFENFMRLMKTEGVRAR